MSNLDKHYLIAYDIADPKRLGRVWRLLKKQALPVQYSVFLFKGSEPALAALRRGIEARIHHKEDDVRIYTLGKNTRAWALGQQFNLGDNSLIDAPWLSPSPL